MIELAAMIRDLREELERAVVAGAGEALQFQLGEIELEMAIAVERSGEVAGKVRFWVVDLGGHAGVDASNTQRLKLSLTPRLGEAGGSVYVAGEPVAGEG